jgi:lysophospholipase L1-like esterase
MHVRHALVTAALVAALVAVPTVLVVAHPAVAAYGSTADATGPRAARIVAARAAELRHTPDQVLTGALGAGNGHAVPFAYAGDSITARPGSWLRDLVATPADTAVVRAVGGYAHSGYRADQVLARMPVVHGEDVLVVELGTNDVNQHVPTATTLTDVGRLVARVGAPHVLLVAAPPSDHTTSLWGVDRRTGNAALDRALVVDAHRHGWAETDPFAADRERDGSWVPGTSTDGIHPTTAANHAIAGRFAAAIVAAAHTARA